MNHEFGFDEYWNIFKKHLKLILVIFLGTVIITFIHVMQLPNIYEARTTFYFPIGEKGGGVLGSLGASGGGGEKEGSIISSLLSTQTSSLQDYTKGILESQRVANLVIDKLNLLQYYHVDEKHRDAIVQLLRGSTRVRLTTEGIMEIFTVQGDPKLAADVANAYVDSFREYSSSSTVSMAKKHRLDVENRMAQLKVELREAESGMASFQSTYQTTDFGEESKMFARSIAALREEEVTTEVSLRSATHAVDSAKILMQRQLIAATSEPLVSPSLQDPILEQLRTQLAEAYVKYAQAKVADNPSNPELASYGQLVKDIEISMRGQIRRQMQARATGVTDDLLDPQIHSAELQGKLEAIREGIKELEKRFDSYPKIGIEYLQQARKLKILESLYTYLSGEYEKAKLEESKEFPDIQVLDKALVPQSKSGPNRLTDLGIGAILGLLLGAGAALISESLASRKEQMI